MFFQSGMEIPGTSHALSNNTQGAGKESNASCERKFKCSDGRNKVVEVIHEDELTTTESIDVVDNDTDIDFQLDASLKNEVKKERESILFKEKDNKLSPLPEIASGISTTTLLSSKGDIEEEIEAIYSWIPDIANHFTIVKKIGEGTFSSVYQAKLRHYPEIDEYFALKHIVPTSHPSRIENELRCLLRIGGKDNVMGVKLCFRNRDHVIIVMPYFPHDKFQDYLQELPFEEAKEYIKNLLVALRRVHQFSVIHRDVKPSNFLYNRETKEFALVDFGLATGPMLSDPSREQRAKKSASSSLVTTVHASSSHNTAFKASHSKISPRIPLSPSKQGIDQTNVDNIHKSGNVKDSTPKLGAAEPRKYFAKNFMSACTQLDGLCDCYGKPIICELCIARNNQVAPRAGTAGFRAPEVLMKSPEQDTAVDIWSAGVIFLSLLSGRYPFFRAQDDLGYLAQIISILGSKNCIQAATAFGKLLTLNESIQAANLETACLKLRESQMAANSYETDEVLTSWGCLNSDAFDLLRKLLDPNPKTRISADTALQHPFFKQGTNRENV